MTTITASRMISTNGKTIKVSLERGTWDEEIRLDGMPSGAKTHPIDRTEIVIYDASGKAVASGSGLSGLSKAYNQYNEAIKRGCIGMVGKCYLMPDTYNLIASALAELEAENPKTAEQIAIVSGKALATAEYDAWYNSDEQRAARKFEREMNDPNSDY